MNRSAQMRSDRTAIIFSLAPGTRSAGGSLAFGPRTALCFALVLLAALLIGIRSAGAAVPSAVFPVATDDVDQLSPAISGQKVAWVEGGDIYVKDRTGAEPPARLTNDLISQGRPVISGTWVVWEENHAGDWEVYGFDLASLPTGAPVPVATGAGDQRNPDISGGTVVWEDNSGDNWDILRRDLQNLPGGEILSVETGEGDQRSPAINGGKVVWQYNVGPGNSDIYFKDLASAGPATQITTDPDWQAAPDISGDKVVWRDERTPGNLDIYAYDLGENREFKVTESPADQWSPRISGRIVVWADGRNNPAGNDIYGEDISTNKEFAVTPVPAAQESPAIDGETVVWEVQRTGASLGIYDVYGADLDTAPAAPTGLKATPSPGGIKLTWTANGEQDLAGYNVYRAASEDGDYTKLNGDALQTPASYNDPGAPKGVRSYYRVTAVDRPANQESAAGRVSAVAPKPAAVSLSTSPNSFSYNGGTTTLSGRLTSGADAQANRAVILEQKPEGTGAWSAVAGGQRTTAADGSFSLAGVRVSKSTQYRARFAGSEDLQAATSPTTMVKVNILLSVGTSARSVKVGRPLTIYGMVLPAHTGKVQLTIRHKGATVNRQFTLLNSSRYGMRYRPLSPGVYYVTATFNSSLGQGVTNTARFVVRR